MKFLIVVALLFFKVVPASAGLWREQVAPVFYKATDDVSVYLWAGGIAAVLLVQPMDQHLQDEWGHHHLMPASQSQIGDRYISYGGNIAIALAQLGWDRDNGFNHVRALFFTTAITESLKLTVHQERPDHSDNYAFPSGHTSSAFATATSLAYAYGWKAGVPAYGMAVFTGLSRIADDKHWASDVVAGAALGMIWGRATFQQKDTSLNAQSTRSSEFFPSYEYGFFSLNFSCGF
ncbi:MAG: phosphatase PAP2 family protein [Bacillota bacterium]